MSTIDCNNDMIKSLQIENIVPRKSLRSLLLFVGERKREFLNFNNTKQYFRNILESRER